MATQQKQAQEIPRVKLNTLFQEKELWLLVLLGVLYFYRPLFLGHTFFFRDISLNILLQKQLLVDFIHTSELPLWNLYTHGGQPYLAEIPYFTLYPPNLLYFFLPFLRAFNLNIVLHFIGSSVCAYLFARTLRFSPIASLIVGVGYGFCGYTLSIADHGCRLLAMPYLPLLFLFWHLYLLEGKRTWFVTTIIVGVLQVFAGASEMNVISLLSLLGWSLVYPYSRTSTLRKIGLWILLGVGIIGLASIQIVPTLEMVSQSSRQQGLTYEAFTQWSLHPKRLPELVFRGFFGYLDAVPWSSHYWGGQFEDRGYPYILSIYLGCIPILFAVFAGVFRNTEDLLSFRVRRFLFLLFVFSLLLALGRFLPFFHVVYQYVPLITVFRYPIKFLLIGIFPVMLLTGYIVDFHFGNRRNEDQGMRNEGQKSGDLATSGSETILWLPSRNVLTVLWSTSIILLSFTLMFLSSNEFANRIQESFFKHPPGAVMRHGLGYSFAHTTAIWLFITFLYQYHRIKRRIWQQWLLAGIFVVDLLSSGTRINPYASAEFFTRVPPIVPIVQSNLSDGRFFRDDNPPPSQNFPNLQHSSHGLLQIPSNSIIWKARWYLEVLSYYTAVLYKIPVIFHEDFTGLAQIRIVNLKILLDALPWQQRLPVLSAGGVTVFLTAEDLNIRGVQRITEIPNWSNIPFYLYRNETAAARVAFVTNWEVVDSDEDALQRMLTPSYDPRKHVILQEPESTLFEKSSRISEIQAIAASFSECGASVQIRKLSSKIHKALFSISTPCDGYLVFSEPYYPGWHVYVDGNPTPILRANYAFSAIFLPAGEHEVQRFYRPNSVLLGVLGSVISCGGLFLMVYKGWFLVKQ